MNIEIIGIIATLMVLVSFTMTGEVGIRSINIIGAVLFVIYGIFLQAFSIWFMNGLLIIIQVYKITQLRKDEI